MAENTPKRYPAKITPYLDGQYIACDDCDLKKARLSMSAAMDLAYQHNTGNHLNP